MTVKAMAELIGRHVSVRYESLEITCRVEDAKVSYGRPRLLIAPLTGSGQQWIESTRVSRMLDDGQSVDALMMAGTR